MIYKTVVVLFYKYMIECQKLRMLMPQFLELRCLIPGVALVYVCL